MAQDAFGLASLYDPSIAVDEAALQRQMALAQALRQQSLDAQGRTQMSGNVAIRNSPLEGVAKVVQALRANQLDSQTDASRQALSTKTMAAMAQLLRGDQPGQPAPQQAPAPVSTAGASLPAGVTPEAMTAGGFPQPPAGQPAPAPTQQPQQPTGLAPNGMGLAQLLRGAVTTSVGGPAMGAAYAKQFEPTDFARTLRDAGIDPNSERGRALAQQQVQKQVNIPRENIRPGGWTRDPVTGQVTQYPQVPQGFVGGMGPNGPTISEIPGGTNALRASTGATEAGKADFALEKVYNPETRSYEYRPRSQVVASAGGPSTQIPPAVQNGRDVDRMGILQEERAGLVKTGQSTANIDKEIALANRQLNQTGGAPRAPMQADPALGAAADAEAGAKNRQGVMKDDYSAMSGQSANAQTVISRLQTIKQLGPQAITGAESDKRDFFNGLLSLAGIKAAGDAKTAGDLIDKNAAQIALAIGAGSTGTDALRSLALTANPGRHMQLDAMQRAADSLIGPLQMTVAKNQLLTPHFTSGDTENYFSKKLAFEKAADPRIWELGNMPPDAQRAYVSKLSPGDAKKLLDARAALKQLGVQ